MLWGKFVGFSDMFLIEKYEDYLREHGCEEQVSMRCRPGYEYSHGIYGIDEQDREWLKHIPSWLEWLKSHKEVFANTSGHYI